jgi:hypothetical protein
MLKYIALLLSLSMASTLFACSSDDGDDDGNGSGAAAGGGGPGPVNVSGGSSGIGDQNGGTRPLTEDQIQQIQDGACAGWSTEGEPLPAVLMLVVDVSGSMEEDAPGPGNASKWEVTRDALSNAIDDLPASSSVGVLYYPNRSTPVNNNPTNASACVNTNAMVPINLLNQQHRTRLQMSLQQADTGNYTPTHDAYTYALDNALASYSSQAPKFMLLITDGAPTMSLGCVRGQQTQDMPTQPIIDAIAAAAAQGMKTFIIGSPGSEESSESNTDMRPWLSRAAQAGQTAIPGCSHNGPNFCHMDMTQEPDFAAALARGLGTVASQIATCTYAIPAPPAGQAIDAGAVNLIVHSSSGSVLVLPDGQGACSEGWRYDDDGNVQLCEATCAAVQNDATARVELLFGCAAGDIPVF